MPLLVNFVNADGSKPTVKVNVTDYTQVRPIDVIQIIYNNNYKPIPGGGGGTTIWKMGKLAGGDDLPDADSLDTCGISDGDTVELRTFQAPATI